MSHFFTWLTSLSAHDWFDIFTRLSVGCSILYSVLPPFEVWSDFPSAQKYYKLLLAFVGGIAINARSKVYPAISTNSGNTTSPAAQSAPGGATGPK